MVFELEQAIYLCGVMAARLSETGTLGLIGGIDLPSIRSTFIAFSGGARAARPEVVVRDVFIGNFDDTAAAREAARALIEEGADLLLHQANDAGRGVFRAVAERAREGGRVFAFGTNRNQNDMAPGGRTGLGHPRHPRGLRRGRRARPRTGTFHPEPLRLGMNEGIVALEINPALRFATRFPAGVLDELALELERKIRSGELVVPRGAF